MRIIKKKKLAFKLLKSLKVHHLIQKWHISIKTNLNNNLIFKFLLFKFEQIKSIHEFIKCDWKRMERVKLMYA